MKIFTVSESEKSINKNGLIQLVPPELHPPIIKIEKRPSSYKGYMMCTTTIFFILLFTLALSEIGHNRIRDERYFQLKWAEMKHRIGLGEYCEECRNAQRIAKSLYEQNRLEELPKTSSSKSGMNIESEGTPSLISKSMIDTTKSKKLQENGLDFLRGILESLREQAGKENFDGVVRISIIKVDPKDDIQISPMLHKFGEMKQAPFFGIPDQFVPQPSNRILESEAPFDDLFNVVLKQLHKKRPLGEKMQWNQQVRSNVLDIDESIPFSNGFYPIASFGHGQGIPLPQIENDILPQVWWFGGNENPMGRPDFGERGALNAKLRNEPVFPRGNFIPNFPFPQTNSIYGPKPILPTNQNQMYASVPNYMMQNENNDRFLRFFVTDDLNDVRNIQPLLSDFKTNKVTDVSINSPPAAAPIAPNIGLTDWQTLENPSVNNVNNEIVPVSDARNSALQNQKISPQMYANLDAVNSGQIRSGTLQDFEKLANDPSKSVFFQMDQPADIIFQ